MLTKTLKTLHPDATDIFLFLGMNSMKNTNPTDFSRLKRNPFRNMSTSMTVKFVVTNIPTITNAYRIIVTMKIYNRPLISAKRGSHNRLEQKPTNIMAPIRPIFHLGWQVRSSF